MLEIKAALIFYPGVNIVYRVFQLAEFLSRKNLKKFPYLVPKILAYCVPINVVIDRGDNFPRVLEFIEKFSQLTCSLIRILPNVVKF